ncbi:hypothetical protein PAQ31011_00546 [Pandoraea aquatica]|uniref:Uncharacterized protein n=1 Tax=Pandoraea aquatica TaxID=2508290 RepID=A0A5E4S5X2_9BURK|nr:hypothetical protein PAQ31011_00546 [Pandoraea aquatica]
MLKDRGLRGRCPTCVAPFTRAFAPSELANRAMFIRTINGYLLFSERPTVYGWLCDMNLSVLRHEWCVLPYAALPCAPGWPLPIGSTVVDLICESAIIEFTSCTIGSCESRSKKNRS